MISREKKYDILVILIDYVNFPRFFATFPDLAPVSQSVSFNARVQTVCAWLNQLRHAKLKRIWRDPNPQHWNKLPLLFLNSHFGFQHISNFFLSFFLTFSVSFSSFPSPFSSFLPIFNQLPKLPLKGS